MMNTKQNAFTDLEHLELVARRIADSGADLTSDYNNWMAITFACASLGEGARESYHLICSLPNLFAVTGVYHISDTFAFSVSVIHREAALREHPQSLLLFSEMYSSPHACPHLLLREFSPYFLLGKQWTMAIVDGVSGLNPTQPDSLPENFN